MGWLSFADATRLRGVVITQGVSFLDAVRQAHRLHINPHGECMGLPFPPDFTPPKEYVNRCLTRDEAAEADKIIDSLLPLPPPTPPSSIN